MQGQPPRQRRSQQADVRRAQYPDDARRTPSYPEYPAYPPASAYQRPVYPPQSAYPPPQGAYPPAEPPRVTYPPTNEPPRGTYPPNNEPPRGMYPPAREPDGRTLRSGRREPARLHERLPGDVKWLVMLVVCALLLLAGGYWASALYRSHYPEFERKEALLADDTFFNGVHIDGVHIGGLTMEQARQAMQQTADMQAQQFSLSVTIDGKTWAITEAQLPLKRNTETVLAQAYAIGRQGTLDTLQSGQTPFEARYEEMWAVGQNGAYLYTQVTYDKATLRALCEKLAGFVNVPVQDAAVYSFDFNSRSFQFQAEREGRYISSEEIYNAVAAQLDGVNFVTSHTGAVSLTTQAQQPRVTQQQLQSNFGLVSTFTTKTLTNYNRNKNIELACAAVTRAVESGKTFSFNETTGRRTVEKGYLPAAAIAVGQSVDETGGGVCQVSSTLFNAAVMANMEILHSEPHAWPSDYVAAGRDATVDWQSWQSLSESLDFKFKNTSDYPIFIVAYLTDPSGDSKISEKEYRGQLNCVVEIYGVGLGGGQSIGIDVVQVSSTPAPLEVERVKNTALPVGTEKEVRKARAGYVMETYRVYYQNGAEIKRELLRTSRYRTYTQKIEYNDGL